MLSMNDEFHRAMYTIQLNFLSATHFSGIISFSMACFYHKKKTRKKVLNTVGIRLATAKLKCAKSLAKLSMSLVHTGARGNYCFLKHIKTLTNWNPYGINRIFNKNTHFVSFLANNIFFSKCLYPLSRLRKTAFNVWGSIQMERR